MCKRGQISLFIVFGLIILITISLFLYINSKKLNTPPLEVPEAKKQSVHNFIDLCLKSESDHALILLGLKGGYLYPNNLLLYNDQSSFDIPYYLYYNDSFVVSKDFLEFQLKNYVLDNFESCINDFNNFEGIKVISSEPMLNVTVGDSVSFSLNYYVGIVSGSSKSFLDNNYNYDVKLRLAEILSIASNITKQGPFVDLNYLSKISSRNFNVTSYTYYSDSVLIPLEGQDHDIVFQITDLNNKIGNEYFIYQFAEKFNISEEEIEI